MTKKLKLNISEDEFNNIIESHIDSLERIVFPDNIIYVPKSLLTDFNNIFRNFIDNFGSLHKVNFEFNNFSESAFDEFKVTICKYYGQYLWIEVCYVFDDFKMHNVIEMMLLNSSKNILSEIFKGNFVI